MSDVERRTVVGSALIAVVVGILGGAVAMAERDALQARGPTIARVTPFIAPVARAAASCATPIRALEDLHERQ